MAVADIDLARELPREALARHALYLDVDGTLLDIAPTPEAVVVPPGLVDALAAVSARLDGALALVSGRPIGALDRLFQPLRLATVGIHGAEVRPVGGPVRTADHLARQLDGVRRELTVRIAQWPGAWLEDKGVALALHYRASAVDAGVIGRALQDIANAAGPEFVLMEGKCVYELKPAALSKASGIAVLRGTVPFVDRIPLCIGDDVTDESAFQYANSVQGVSVHVGSSASTVARWRVAAPGVVRAWLADLAGSTP
ncbi:MAG: trehalose-phosphatase [Steroidobacteraceae bacterium]